MKIKHHYLVNVLVLMIPNTYFQFFVSRATTMSWFEQRYTYYLSIFGFKSIWKSEWIRIQKFLWISTWKQANNFFHQWSDFDWILREFNWWVGLDWPKTKLLNGSFTIVDTLSYWIIYSTKDQSRDKFEAVWLKMGSSHFMRNVSTENYSWLYQKHLP